MFEFGWSEPPRDREVDAFGEGAVTSDTGALRALDVTLDARKLRKLRTALTTGTVAREILRHNQRTSSYVLARTALSARK